MEMERLPDVEKGQFKARAFQKACKALDALPNAITSGDEALNVSTLDCRGSCRLLTSSCRS